MGNSGHALQMKQWVRDLIYGLVIIAFAIGNIFYGRSLPPGSIKLRVAQAGFYLELVCIAFCFLGVLMVIRALVKKPQELCQPLFSQTGVVTIVLLALYLLTLRSIGFILGSFLLVFLLSTYYGYKMGKLQEKGAKRVRRVIIYAIYSAIVTGISYYLFSVVMTVILPRFTLFGFGA